MCPESWLKSPEMDEMDIIGGNDGGGGHSLLELFYFNSAFGICEEDFCVKQVDVESELPNFSHNPSIAISLVEMRTRRTLSWGRIPVYSQH